MGKKGWRHRVQQAHAVPRHKSELVQWLLAEWAWGHLSPQQLQKISELVRRDMVVALEQGSIPTDIDLWQIWVGQAISLAICQEISSTDLERTPTSYLLCLFHLQGHAEPILQHLLLPHEVVAKMFPQQLQLLQADFLFRRSSRTILEGMA